MSSEEIAYHAGKLTAETILTDGAMRVVGSTLQVVRLEESALYQIAKEGARDLASTTVAKTAQTIKKITLTADQLGTKMAQALLKPGETAEIAVAGAESVFKTTIKNPGVAEACENIAKNPPKMELVKEAGQAGIKSAPNKGATIEKCIIKKNPLENVKFTDKVKSQISQADHHGFPKSVEAFGSESIVSKIKGGDGVIRTKIEIQGSYMGKDGIFEYIIEPDGITCNHRLFKPSFI